LIDIREKIKKDINQIMPGILVKLINSCVENDLTPDNFLLIIRSKKQYEDKILEHINRTGPLISEDINEALETYGTEYCSSALMNILLLELSGKNDAAEISGLMEMQLFTAVSSHVIARKCKIQNPYLAYIGGLMSNISYFYLSKFYGEEFSKLTSKDKNLIKRMNYEWETFGIDHAEISYLILGSARILPEIYTPVRFHHQKSQQDSLGADNINNLSLAVYFGSLLTNLFYEDFNITVDFRKDIKSLMGIQSHQLEGMIEEIIDTFKTEAGLLGLKKFTFPGYFKVISWYETKIAMIESELEITSRKVVDLNQQNVKFQKVLEDNNKKLVGIALKDPLTGAYNRRYLDERLHDEFLKAKRYNQSFIVISCDIDHFKIVNDTYGHAFGDIVLMKIVQIIQSAIRKTDYIARTGGEEFIVICHSSNELGGIIIAEKMRKTIEKASFNFEGKNIPITMSFGVVNYFPEVKSVDELIRISDDRLYAAKNAGRNKVIYK